MKFMWLLGSVAAFALVSQNAAAIKLLPPPTVAQLAGTWLGPDQHGSLLRLTLDSTGRGTLEISHPWAPRDVEVYRVQLHKERLSTKLSFTFSAARSANADFIGLSGSTIVLPTSILLVEHFKRSLPTGVTAIVIPATKLQSGLSAFGAVQAAAPTSNGR